MKTVGKQLQEARLARNWTPELAARETKIKVDRLGDLERDDYSHFTSPTYARGFVRTYARALGLDEYQILRQLDNKLPDDDSANIVTDTGVAYLPETAMPPRVAHRNYAGLYIVMALGFVVTLAIVFVLFEAYRVGELSRYFAGSSEPASTGTTNAAPATAVMETDNRAKPLDSNTPPPITDTTNVAAAPVDASPGTSSPRALPVDPAALSATPAATATPVPDTDAPVHAVRALPVDPSVVASNPATSAPEADAPVHALRALPVNPTDPAPVAPPPNSPAPDTVKAPPRALPVDPSDQTQVGPTATPTTLVAVNTPPPASTPPVVTPIPAPAPTAPSPGASARPTNNGPVMEPSLPAVEPSATAPAASDASADANKRLVLTASQDSFVRVTNLDAPEADKPLYAAVLHSGQSVGFDGRKFSINVGVPSAVDIKLDGVNYGPHSDQDAPETFTVQSHQP